MAEVIILRRLGVPLATDARSLSRVPSRLVDDWLILEAGIDDAEEWKSLEASKKK